MQSQWASNSDYFGKVRVQYSESQESIDLYLFKNHVSIIDELSLGNEQQPNKDIFYFFKEIGGWQPLHVAEHDKSTSAWNFATLQSANSHNYPLASIDDINSPNEKQLKLLDKEFYQAYCLNHYSDEAFLNRLQLTDKY